MKKWVATLLLSGGAISLASAQVPDRYVTLSTSWARTLAMGGACTSVESMSPGQSLNPASFSSYRQAQRLRLGIALNPLGLGAALQEGSNLNGPGGLDRQDWLFGAGLFLRSVRLTARAVDIGLSFSEQMFDGALNGSSPRFFDGEALLSNHASNAVVRLRLARVFSFGVGGSMRIERDSTGIRHYSFGVSYGMLLKPDEKFSAGIAYVDSPERPGQEVIPLQRVVDRTVNVGLNYRIVSSSLVALDIRNVSDENRSVVREVHLGLEQSVSWVGALRAGYYRRRPDGTNVFSVGIGLFDINALFHANSRLNGPRHVLNYALIIERERPSVKRWHFLSFIFRI